MENKIPIAVIAYNRPNYLYETLSSIVNQISGRKVFLFLDGSRSSGEKHLIDACAKIFNDLIPQGYLYCANENLGVAFNTKRARDFIFREFERGIFIEDDVVLQSYYFEQLEILDKILPYDVAMISAFGDHDVSLADQIKNSTKLISMKHVWAYLLRRFAYLEICRKFQEFLDLLPAEYRNRPHDQIIQWHKSHGSKENRSSQDHAFILSMLLKGLISVSTYTNNLRYIGAVGEHQRPDGYNKYGYDKWDLYGSLEKDFSWGAMDLMRIKGEYYKQYFGFY